MYVGGATAPGVGSIIILCLQRRFATLHKKVIQRWGRFPHRNALLGRESTPEEAAGMAEGTIPRF